jgi:hypothetical protein
LAAARTGKNRLIEQAKRQGRLKRAAIKLMKGQRVNKKILYALVSKTLQADIEKIRKHDCKERQTIVDNYQRSTWADWQYFMTKSLLFFIRRSFITLRLSFFCPSLMMFI